MYKNIYFALAVATAGAGAAPGAAAQEARPDPADPQTKVRPLVYRSAFEDFRRFAQTEVAPWREVNEEAARAGAHGSHAAPPASGPGAEAPGAKREAPAGGHAGHHGEGGAR